ncbi:MAG: DNA-packaging protein [Syntrophobacteria bacterium]
MARSKHGRDKIFQDESILWEAATEYFQWVEDNPLEEEKAFAYQGEITKDTVSKMRAMTMEGLCLFLGISTQTWYDYAERDDFIEITKQIENVVRSQKFAGAAADLLNANIIARDLGLKDVSRSEHTGADGGAIKTQHAVFEFVPVGPDEGKD